MSEKLDVRVAAQKAIEDETFLKELVENLAGSSRRERQNSASVIAQVAKSEPALLSPFISEMVDALNRPEAQTRWECLDALTSMVDVESRGCDRALNGAESALFDEESGTVRLAALRFLCRLGATTEHRSERVWTLLDEAIQCYHGDLEFQDMLVALLAFSEGKLSPMVKEAFAKRMKFDAESGKGTLKRRAAQIIQNVS